MNAANPQVRLQINHGGGATAGEVICKLEDKNNDGRFEFSDAAHPYPVMGRGTLRNPIRTIVDLDGDADVKYEDSILMAYVDVAHGAITKLSKGTIYKLVLDDPTKHATKKINNNAGFTVGGNLIYADSNYDAAKLLERNYVLNLFEHYFFIPKDSYDDAVTAAGANINPLELDFDVYVLQNLVDAAGAAINIHAAGHGKVICELETIDNDQKFDFSGIPYQVIGGKHPIIDLDGYSNVFYTGSNLDKTTQVGPPAASIRLSPKTVAKTLARRQVATYFTLDEIKKMPVFTGQNIDDIQVNNAVQNPAQTIRKELIRTYVAPLNSTFKPNLDSKLIFHLVNNRLFCTITGENYENLYEVKSYLQRGFNTYILTFVEPMSLGKHNKFLKNKYYIPRNATDELSVANQVTDPVFDRLVVRDINTIGYELFNIGSLKVHIDTHADYANASAIAI
jgi:hypothetical protein